MTELPRLPDEVIEHTRQLLEQQDGHQWVLGDHLVSVCDELGSYYESLLSKDKIANASRKARAHIIRQLSIYTGADTSTLRDRHNMCRFYPPEIRVGYEALSWSQMRACKAAGERWQEYAAWSLDNLPAPVSVIRARIKYNGDLPPAWIWRWERMQRLGEMLMDDEQAPSEVRIAGGIIRAIQL